MQMVNYSLPELLKKIKGESFRIPQFQRDFRWTGAQVKLLVDSIARNYPMGSLLVLAKNPEVPLESRGIQAQIRSDELQDNDDGEAVREAVDVYYVLDGQQRLTSVARVLINADPSKNYYFDLKQMVDSFWNEDTAWIKARQRGKKDPERKENNRLLRADVALEQQKADIYISEYVEDSDDFPQFANDRRGAREIAAKLKGVFETIRKYQVPIVVLDRDAGLDSVCRVFETINSTGTRLTTFDLAVARFYPDPDLRTLWDTARAKRSVLAEFEVDGERALQVLVLRYAQEQERADEPTRNNQLQLRPEYVCLNWEMASDCLARAYEWAKEQGATAKTLPNHGLLASLASHWCARQQCRVDESVLRRWFYSNLLQTGSGQAANYKIRRYFVDLGELNTPRPEMFPPVYLVPDTILRINKFHDSRFKSLQCMMALTVSEDLIIGRRLEKSEIEYHHIFPRSMSKTHSLSKSLLDCVANRIALSKESNRDLGDKAPQEYFKELRDQAVASGTLPGLQKRLRDCLIPGDPNDESEFLSQFEAENLPRFLHKRAELIHDYIKIILGDSLIAAEPDDYDDES